MSDAGEETQSMQDGKRKDPLPFGWFALFTPSDAMPRDRGLYARRRAIVVGVGLFVLAVTWMFARSDAFVEDAYADGLGQALTRGLGTASGVLPTSVAEVLVLLTVAWFSVMSARGCWHVMRRKRRILNALACGTLHFGCFAVWALALFYVLWGVNYARAPMIERMQWHDDAAQADNRETQADELARLCEELVVATNVSYASAMGSEDYGAPSNLRADPANLDAALDRGHAVVQQELGLNESYAASRGRAKPVALSGLMSYLRISGFYFPWTGEANYSRDLPACMTPMVISHEKAHQRCITSEDEANFLGFLACIRSGEPYAAYSGYLFAQRQLLSELARLDMERVRELLERRVPGVQRDVDNIHAWWRRLDTGVAKQVGEASRAVNDTYLKVHDVEGGVVSYRKSVKLMIVYARRKGTLLWLPAD